MKLHWLMLLCVCSAVAAPPERAPGFARSGELVLDGKGAIYAVELPVDVLQGVQRRDLGDLRVINGAGEAVPHALLRQAGSEKKARASASLAYFPLLGQLGRPVEDMTLRIDRSPDGTLKAVLATHGRGAPAQRLMGYVLDASAQKEPLRELRLEWQAAQGGMSMRVRLEASDDLGSWSTVAASAPLVELTRGEAVLERRNIEFSPTRAKYYRLSWGAQQPALQLTGVTAFPVDAVADAPRSWLKIPGKAGGKPGEYSFELPRSLPVDRVRFDLPQENTVAPASLAAQEKPGAPERPIARFVLYHLDHRGEQLLNPDLTIPATSEPRWILRVDARGGGLGGGLPTMHVGWNAQRLVFVARGEPPFRLQFGSADAKPAALAAETIVPGYSPDKPLDALMARVGEIRDVPLALPATGIEALREQIEQVDRKKALLWGALIAAVLLIVVMATKLSKQLPPPRDETPRTRPFDQ